MKKITDDLRIRHYTRLISPREMKQEIPVSDAAAATVVAARAAIERIIRREDPRLLVVSGPCSIHEETGALEYAARLLALQRRVQDVMVLVMRGASISRNPGPRPAGRGSSTTPPWTAPAT